MSTRVWTLAHARPAVAPQLKLRAVEGGREGAVHLSWGRQSKPPLALGAIFINLYHFRAEEYCGVVLPILRGFLAVWRWIFQARFKDITWKRWEVGRGPLYLRHPVLEGLRA